MIDDKDGVVYCCETEFLAKLNVKERLLRAETAEFLGRDDARPGLDGNGQDQLEKKRATGYQLFCREYLAP